MLTLDFAPVDMPQLSPWMQHQREWWRTLTHVPSPPARERDAHEPLSYDESERLRTWRREAEDVVERYEGYLKTEAGQQDLLDLDQSRQHALDCIATIGANDTVGECRKRFLNAGQYVWFLKDTAHPAIALLRDELRLRRAEYKRELAEHAIKFPAADFIGAEAAYQKQHDEREQTIQRCERLLSTDYATHAEAAEILAKAKAAMSEIGRVPRDQIYPVATVNGRITDEMEAELNRYRQRAY